MTFRFNIGRFQVALNRSSVTARFSDLVFLMLSIKHGLRIDVLPFSQNASNRIARTAVQVQVPYTTNNTTNNVR